MKERANDSAERSLLQDALRSTTRVVARSPRATLWLVLLSCCAGIGLTVSMLNFKTARADLIDPRAAYHQRWLDYTDDFGDASDIIVVVEAEDPLLIKQTLDELGERLDREDELFLNSLYRIEPGKLREKGLQYLTPRQLEAGLERIKDYGPVLRGNWDLVALEGLVNRLRYQIQSRSQQQQQAGSLFQHSEQLVGSLDGMLRDRSEFTSPWPVLLPVDSQMLRESNQVVYLMNDSGTMGFLKVQAIQDPSDFAGSTRAITRLREILDEVGDQFPDISLGATGIPILEFDEMQRSQTDMIWASLISFAGVGLILLTGFRGFRHPLLALLMLAVGMTWAFGYTTLTVGHLNILSVSFAAILIGLGIDFAIHYMARYLELRHEGQMLRPALLESSSSVGSGIITAAITTSLAFFCASFTEFLGVAELGLIAAGGILLCALATFVVLPALIAVADQQVEPRRLPTPFQGNALRRMISQYPIAVSVASLGLVAVIGIQMVRFRDGEVQFRVGYDYNLLNLQAEGLESVELQKKVFQNANDSLLFAVAVADSAEEAITLRKQFEQLPTVARVEELASRLPQIPTEKTRLLVQGFQAQLAKLPVEVPRLQTPDPARVGVSLERLYVELLKHTDPAARRAASQLNRFLNSFESLPLQGQLAYLTEYEMRCTGALLAQFQQLASAANAEPVTVNDLPESLRSRFISSEGRWLVQVYPREQIWDIEPLTRFVNDVRTVDPDVTGTPLQNYEASRAIMDSYEAAAVYALAVIIIVLLVDFLDRDHRWFVLLPPAFIVAIIWVSLRTRGTDVHPILLAGLYIFMALSIAGVLDIRNLRNILFTLLPPLGGAVLMFGAFAVLGVDLNPANLIVLPLVLGIGVDDGVHVVHDFRLQTGRYRLSASTMNAIVLTSLTTMIGFGSMMVASHRGLYSVGLVMVIGVGACLFLSLVALPSLLTVCSGSRDESDESGQSGSKPRRKSVATAA